MVEEDKLNVFDEDLEEDEPQKESSVSIGTAVYWFKTLVSEMHWSFVFGVVIVYGISQGLGGALNRVATEYYMKDVQKVQPSEAQVYSGITSIPWMVKPIWGLFTDLVPVLGYHRRPYFVFAGKVICCVLLIPLVFMLDSTKY